MEFSVNTAALPGLADMLNRRRDDLFASRDYVDVHTHISAHGQGIFNLLIGGHTQIVAGVKQFLTLAAEERAARYSGAVTDSVSYYSRSDAQSAAALDASYRGTDAGGYPPLSRRRADQGLGPEVFTDNSCNPGLPAPRDQRFQFRIIQSGFDVFSPTRTIRTRVWDASSLLVKFGLMDHPVDVFDEIIHPLVGDWAAYATCSEAFQSLATVLDFESDSTNHAANAVHQLWTGNAADSCQFALDVFGFDLRTGADTVRALGTLYAQCSDQIQRQAELLDDYLTILGDTAVDLIEILSGDEVEAVPSAISLVPRFLKTLKEIYTIAHTIDEIVEEFVKQGTVTPGALGIVLPVGPLKLTEVAALPQAGVSNTTPTTHSSALQRSAV
jgi:hypothetical protein